jgi:hypothetical protein
MSLVLSESLKQPMAASTPSTLNEMISIFKQHEDELQERNPQFVALVHSLLQKGVMKGRQVGGNFAPSLTRSISRPTLNCGSKDKKKHAPPSARVLELEEQVRQLQNTKLDQDTAVMQQIVAEEEGISQETILPENAMEDPAASYFDTCDDCGLRHGIEERECHYCGEVHEGCCDL